MPSAMNQSNNGFLGFLRDWRLCLGARRPVPVPGRRHRVGARKGVSSSTQETVLYHCT